MPLNAVRALCERYHVRELALFGSALGNNFTPRSDVDLLVEFEADAQIGFVTLARLKRELSELESKYPEIIARDSPA